MVLEMLLGKDAPKSKRASPLTAYQRQLRWGFLGLSATPLVGAVLYNQGWRLPFACPIRCLTGVPCPTCGMTRSIMAIARGDWQTAISMHLFGPILFLICTLVITHTAFELLANRQLRGWHLQVIRDRRLYLSGIASYALYYSLRLYQLSVTGELATSFTHSPLGRLLLNV
jgi:hypothetical protein